MIRKARVDDAETIARIHVQAWREAYRGIVPPEYLAALSEEKRAVFWRDQLTVGRSITLVALEEGEVVGWASGGPSEVSASSLGSEVYAIYLAPAFWRRGVGRALMKEIEGMLRGSVVLWVLRENQSARRFYEALGYLPDGAEKEADFGGIRLTEIRLRKKSPIG